MYARARGVFSAAQGASERVPWKLKFDRALIDDGPRMNARGVGLRKNPRRIVVHRLRGWLESRMCCV